MNNFEAKKIKEASEYLYTKLKLVKKVDEDVFNIDNSTKTSAIKKILKMIFK